MGTHLHEPALESLNRMVTPSPIPPEQRLLTKAEAADYFGVTVRTIEVWMSKGILPYRKLFRTVRFKLSDLSQALDGEPFLIRRRQ